MNSVKEWFQNVKVGKNEIKCAVDTGAEVNILNMEVVKKIGAKVRKSNVKLKNYNGSSIKVVGETTV